MTDKSSTALSAGPHCARPTDQVGHVELEVAGELLCQLVDAVQPLQEDGAALVGVLCADGVPTPVAELVAKVEPLPLQQRLEALWRQRRMTSRVNRGGTDDGLVKLVTD